MGRMRQVTMSCLRLRTRWPHSWGAPHQAPAFTAGQGMLPVGSCAPRPGGYCRAAPQNTSSCSACCRGASSCLGDRDIYRYMHNWPIA